MAEKDEGEQGGVIMAVMWGWYPGHGGAKKCLRAGVLRARIGVEKIGRAHV